MIEIDIDPSNDESRRLWSSLGDLVALLPPGWVLIGGLTVQPRSSRIRAPWRAS